MTKRRWVARLLMPVLVVWFSVMPYREARAFLPLAVPLAVALIDATGATVATVGVPLAGLAAGAGVGWLISKAGDAAFGSVAVPTTSATPVPAPVVTAQAPAATVTYCFSTYCNTTEATACAAWANPNLWAVQCTPSTRPTSYQLNGNTCSVIWPCTQSNLSATFSYTCPAGYTVSGSACVLTDARQVVNDGRGDMTRSGTALAQPAASDLKGSMSGALATTTAANDTAVFSGQDIHGNPQRVAVQALSSGGSTVTISTQKMDGAGNTYLQNDVMTANASGQIVTEAKTSSTGVLTANTATGQWDVGAGTASTYTPAGSQDAATTAFPSDYARSGEAAAGAASINATLSPKLDTLHHDLADVGALPADPLADDTYKDFGDTFNALRGWQVPSHSSTCPSGSFVAFGHTFVLDGHCVLMAQYQSVISSSMSVAWTLLALFIILGA